VIGQPIIVISDRDNVATALEPLEKGRSLEVRGHVISVRDAVPSGHKIALARIGTGEAVVKYGSPIGRATADIEPGTHVHVHNLASTRGRGDLAADGAEQSS
jgi:altronate dehydratase small subunit